MPAIKAPSCLLIPAKLLNLYIPKGTVSFLPDYIFDNITGGRGVIFVLSMKNFVRYLVTFSRSSH